MNILLCKSLSACVCVQEICKEPKQKVAMRTCPFAMLLPLALAEASFKNGKTASLFPVLQYSLSHLGRQPASAVTLEANQIFRINTLIGA